MLCGNSSPLLTAVQIFMLVAAQTHAVMLANMAALFAPVGAMVCCALDVREAISRKRTPAIVSSVAIGLLIRHHS
jgi:hypothetical protein